VKPHILLSLLVLLFPRLESNSLEQVRVYSLEQIPTITTATMAAGLNFVATVTAYSSTRRQTSSHPKITASGKHVSDGVIACPRKFPFGTKVTIDGKVYTCQDRLNRKYDSRFDIWKPNTRAAKVFGKRELPIVVEPVATDAATIE
jgi:3D (Asp-Asp-Asp) domain-containing protein